MINIQKATKTEDYQIIETLAKEILHEVYDPIIPAEHTTFFLNKFQTTKAIAQQIIEEGFEYHMLQFQAKNVGYIGYYVRNNILYLSKIYILKSSRGNKIGKAALEFIIQKATKLNVNEIELLVNQQNDNTIQFYKINDFKIVKAITNTFSDGFSVEDYIMKKKMK